MDATVASMSPAEECRPLPSEPEASSRSIAAARSRSFRTPLISALTSSRTSRTRRSAAASTRASRSPGFPRESPAGFIVLSCPSGGGRLPLAERTELGFEMPDPILQRALLAVQLVAVPTGQVGVPGPPVDPELLRLVRRCDQETQLDGEQLDVEQVDGDVAGHHDALVQHTIENVHEARPSALGDVPPRACPSVVPERFFARAHRPGSSHSAAYAGTRRDFHRNRARRRNWRGRPWRAGSAGA